MILRGAFPVLPTPFDSEGAVDPQAFDRIIDFAVTCGAQGCVYPGVASEVDTLSDDEREAQVARLGARLAGRIPFVVGASAPTPEAVLNHIRIGAAAGAAVAMVIAPGSIGRDAAAQTAFFAAIAKDSPLPIMLQNQPVPIGAGLSAEMVAEIAAAVPNLRYVKEETLPCGQNLTLIRAACGDAIDGVFGGAGGRYITDELARGSLGTMPAVEFTDLHVRLFNAWQDGDISESRRLFMVALPALNLQAVFRMHMTKHTLMRRGVLGSVHVRGKGPAMDAEDRRELDTLLSLLSDEFQTCPLNDVDGGER
ncbi:dihydrodipicolinate synthase family protein [Oceaniglobus trochenteri]|uniref:dihydrodipicolinate synthase family protein n=1 Tax=Oceaniglobus trochenteri TaxID=2763260 RepID=UPI001CFFBD6D|nr:dihydrodipicolinate synthase family protein [Oceaniglobus trochenteri]